MKVNYSNQTFGSNVKLGKGFNTTDFSDADLRKSFEKVIPPAQMDEFSKQIDKFKTFMEKDGDDKFTVSLQPCKKRFIKIIGGYFGPTSSMQVNKRFGNINTLGERMIQSAQKIHNAYKKCVVFL